MAKAKKKTNRWWIIGGVVLIAALIGLAAYQAKNRPQGEEVTFSKVEKKSIVEKVSASGKVFPETEVKISSDVSGEIVELNVAEGDSVKMGQVLAKIDAETYESMVERGMASLQDSRTQLASAISMIENSRAQKDQMTAQLTNARQVFDRNKQLFEEGVISASEYEASESTVQQLEASVRSMEASIISSEEGAQGARFRVQSAEASLREMQTSLSRTTLTAPIDGVISKLNVEQGERVVGTMQMSGTELMRIANLTNMEVQVEVSENDIVRVTEGDSVEIEIDAFLDHPFTGHVTEIANTASGATVGGQVVLTSDQVTNFVVKIRIDPSSYAEMLKEYDTYPFRPGMSASVEILTNTRDEVLSIPIQAVTAREKDEDNDDTDDFIEVVFVRSGDTVIMKEVKTGIQDDEFIEVLTGLEGDEEIVEGPYSAVAKKLEDGSKVHEKKEDDDKEEDD